MMNWSKGVDGQMPGVVAISALVIGILSMRYFPSENYTFIDARDEADYKAGSIKGAINIPYHKIDQFQDKLNSLPKDRVYVAYCSSACDVSIDLAYAMAKQGFTKVYIFHGGWDEWKAAGYPQN